MKRLLKTISVVSLSMLFAIVWYMILCPEQAHDNTALFIFATVAAHGAILPIIYDIIKSKPEQL